MALKHKLTALAVLALAVLFSQFFMFTKHEPSLAAIIPFADDPYDAIGSIAMIISALLAILSLFRAFRPHRPGSPPMLDKVFLARTQIAVALSVLVALCADGVAMVRHPSMWTGKPATGELLALMAGMAAISLAVLFLIRLSVRGIGFPAMQHESRSAIVVVLLCVATLALFPEDVIQNVLLHFLTIIVGFILFFAPLSALAVALLPYDTAETRIEGATPRSHFRLCIQWGAVAILGLAIGAFALILEIGEGTGSAPLHQILVVSAVFIGAGISGLLIAFAYLKKPLGLFRMTSH